MEPSATRARYVWLQRIFETACGLSSVGIAIFALYFVKRTAVDVPFWDEWDWTRLIVSLHQGTVTFGELWRQHNEHRMFFPSLIAIGLDMFGGWSQVRECLTSVAVVIVGQFILLKLLRATFPRPVVLPLLLIFSLLLFSPSQSENWTWGFQLAWFLINTAAFGTVWFLSRPKLNPALLSAAAACAVVAAYSIASGLNVLLAGLIVLMFRRDISRGALRDWIVLSLAVIALYLIHFHRAPSTPATDAASVNPLSLANYFFSYLGIPLGRWMGLEGSTVVGAFGFAIFAMSSVAIVGQTRKDETGFESALPWFALAGYAMAAGGLTAIGRAHFGVEQSLAARYETTAAVFWIATVALCTQALSGIRTAPRARVARALAMLALIAGVWLYGRNAALGAQEMHAYRLARATGRTVLALGDAAPDSALGTLYPNTELIRYYMNDLRRVGDGPPIGPDGAAPFSSGKDLPPSLGFIAGAGKIDTVAWRSDAAHDHPLVAGQDISRDAHLEVDGWAGDPAAAIPAEALIAMVDGRPIYKNARLRYGLPRPDVASALGGNYGSHTGYRFDLNVAALKPGTHAIVLGALRWDRLGFYAIDKPINFVVSADASVPFRSRHNGR